jgi:hypothetical protein
MLNDQPPSLTAAFTRHTTINGPRILTLDIEVAPHVVDVWAFLNKT